MAKRQSYSRIPVEAAAPLGILVEAAAAPDIFEARHLVGTKIERAEALDALSHGAVTLPHLMWEWAIHSGRISVRAGLSRVDDTLVDGRDFHAAMGVIARLFPLQFSMPLPPRGKNRCVAPADWPGWRMRRMRPSGKSKLQMVDRTTFEEIAYGLPDDIRPAELEAVVAAAEKRGGAPCFEEPALRLAPGTPVGLVWVRIVPEIVKGYRKNPAILLSLIAKLQRTRLTLLRRHIADSLPPLNAKEAERMNAYLGSEMQVVDAFEGAAIRIRQASRASGQQLRKRLADIASPTKRMHRATAPIVFISYSHADAKHRVALCQHLALLEREGKARIWWDERIEGGGHWEKEIAAALTRASIVVLLVSRHFLSSEYCYEQELRAALRKAERGAARVIPAIIGTCAWKRTPMSRLLAVPKDGKPLTAFRDRDVAYLEIANSIEQAVARRIRLRRRAPVGRGRARSH